LIGRLKQTSPATREHTASVAAILVFNIILFIPVIGGYTFSMVGAHMFALYPWIGIIKSSPEIRGRGYMQTDHADFFYPATVFATNAIRSGQFPMWLPYSFNGIPVMEVGIGYGLLYPPRLLAATVLSPIRQHNFMLFTHLLLAGLGMYALLRCWGVNALGAVMGAMVWELNGHHALYLTFEHVAISSAWFPLMLLGATLAIRKQSVGWAVGTGAALGMSLLGNVHNAYVSAWVLAGWYFVLTVLAARKLFLKRQRRAAVFCLCLPLISATVTLALGAASWLTLLGALSHVSRGPVTLEQQLILATPLRDLLRALMLPVSAEGMAGKAPDFPSFAFVGTPALIFVLAGFLRRSTPARLAGFVALISFGTILGFSPLIRFLRLVVPQFAAMHIHDVGFYLFCFALATLAAFGVTEAGSYFQGGRSQRHLFLKMGILLIAVEALQLIVFAWITNPIQPARSEWLFPETPLISSLKAQQGEFHILPIYLHLPSGEWTPPVLGGNVAADFDLRSGSGYESILPISTTVLWQTVERGGVPTHYLPPRAYRPYFYQDRLPITLLEKISIGFLAAPPNTKPRDVNGSDPVASGALRLIYSGPDGDIYKVTRSLPRAFLTPQVLVAPDDSTSLKMLVDEAFDARKAAIVVGEGTAAKTGLPSLNSSGVELAASANIVTDRVNEVEVAVDTPRAAMLVLNDSWDGGWRARVDGAEQPVLRVNYGFRGVVVQKGTHRVNFRYRPTILLVGIAISGGTLLLLLIACAWLGILRLHRFYRSASSTPGRLSLGLTCDLPRGSP
jgi:hypothetical protein